MSCRNVLIVDDDRDIAHLLAEVLEMHGYIARSAHSGAEGVQATLEHRPDAVVLDLMLPDMDGIEVCRRIRIDERGAGVAILLLTAAIGDQHRARALAAGADRYLNKPFDAEGIARELNELLASKS